MRTRAPLQGGHAVVQRARDTVGTAGASVHRTDSNVLTAEEVAEITMRVNRIEEREFASIEDAWHIGRLLLQAKERLPRGRFTPFLLETFPQASRKTLYFYMGVVQNNDSLEAAIERGSIAEARKPFVTPGYKPPADFPEPMRVEPREDRLHEAEPEGWETDAAQGAARVAFEETVASLPKAMQKRMTSAIEHFKHVTRREVWTLVRERNAKELNSIADRAAAVKCREQEVGRREQLADGRGPLLPSDLKILKQFVHPDRHPNNEAKATKIMVLVNKVDSMFRGNPTDEEHLRKLHTGVILKDGRKMKRRIAELEAEVESLRKREEEAEA